MIRFRSVLVYCCLLPLGACTRSCNDYDNANEFTQAKLPEYSETGAHTLGCRLGSQVWTVLGKHEITRVGYPWDDNTLMVSSSYSQPAVLSVQGEMTGVRDSRVFYDMELSLSFLPSDTLGGLRLLGADSAHTTTGWVREYMRAVNLMDFHEYQSRPHRPVRLLIQKRDPTQRIISGTFAGYLYGGASGNDSLAVSDGRFDLKY
jgi:hypothetical protein